jgi:hypothetical protein
LATFDQLLEPFAKSIHAKCTALNKLELREVQKARLLEAVSDDIKKQLPAAQGQPRGARSGETPAGKGENRAVSGTLVRESH